ncbi:MAG: hypothetical protein ACHREM_14600 [Polyangiales bacterium]
MIQRTTFIGSAFVVAGLLGFSIGPACSSSSTPAAVTDSGTTGGDAVTDSGAVADYGSIVPPGTPGTASTGTEMWFAVNMLGLGLSDKGTGVADKNAWKTYGFDVDGRLTDLAASKANTNSCMKVSGAPSNVLVDGNGGIDNNFGSQVMTVISSLKSDAEATVNASITAGKFTLLLRLQNVSPTFADGTGVSGEVYVANGATGFTPTFTTADTWPVLTSSLTDTTKVGDKTNAKLTFPGGYISNGYWVSGPFGSGTINLEISLSGADIVLPIESGVITVKLSDGSDGTIAGAVDTGQLKTALTPVAEKFGICPGNSTFDSVVKTLQESADLVSAAVGTQLQDPTKTCDAISIALGFTMKPTGAATTVIAPSTSGSTGCDDGGVSETGTSDAGTGDAASGG